MAIDRNGNMASFSKGVTGLVNSIFILIWEKHPLVGRKLSIALDQFQNASSIEEYQQIGILIRDAWIEFAQKLFSLKSAQLGSDLPSTSDAKGMLLHTIRNWPNYSKRLMNLCKAAIDLANEVQHKRTVDKMSVEHCLLSTLLTMVLILDLDHQYDRLADRRYYRCPRCGSLDLVCKKGMEVDYHGPGPEYEDWHCESCDWEQWHYL